MLVVNTETSVFLPIHFEPKAARQNHSIFADQPSRNTNGSFIKYDALQPAGIASVAFEYNFATRVILQ